MTEMESWAVQELERAGYRADDAEEGPNKWMRDGVLDLLRVFSDQGHSGMSAPYAVAIFERLASWKPLTPLTGKEDEWIEVGGGLFQNNRFPEVFQDDDGAYWSSGIVFWEWATDHSGEKYKSYFTSRDSRVPITFPFSVPDKPEYRERPQK